MSTQIQLHERTEEMHDKMLRSEGHLRGGELGIMDRMASTNDYFDEFHDLASEADSIIVGNDVHDDGAEEIAQLFSGVTEVCDANLREVSAIIANSEDVDPNLLEWLEQRKGQEVFSIHW